jgi:hypothetical protein
VGHELLRTMAVYPFVSFPVAAVRRQAAVHVLGAGRLAQLPFADYDLASGQRGGTMGDRIA